MHYRPTCEEPRMYNLPFKGWPCDVIDNLTLLVPRVLQEYGAGRFYIGRSNDIGDSASLLGCRHALPLYQDDNAENAMAVEEELLRMFFDHPRCVNTSHEDEEDSSDEYTNYVFLAIWR